MSVHNPAVAQAGRYHGVGWVRRPLSDVFPYAESTARWYFVLDGEQETGDHFRTLADLREFVDSAPSPTPALPSP